MLPLAAMATLQNEVDSESVQVNSDCLSVPLILREIFQYFTSTELLQFSLVNKRWSYETRSLVRTRGNVTANINKNQACPDLRTFASDLRRIKEITKVLPFSGMTISVGGTECSYSDYSQQPPNPDLEPVYEEIIECLTWKHFSLKHLVGWAEHESCPGFLLGKKILRKLDSVLEELSIQLQPHFAKYFQDKFVEDCQFSRLKTFRLLNEDRSFESGWSNLIKTVVSHAPNLQVFYTKECVNLEDGLLQGSSAVHMAGSTYSTSRNEIPESVAGQLKLEIMDLLSFSSDFSLDRFNRITPTVLQSSHTVLSNMYINISFLAPLMTYGICLANVTTLRLAPDLEYLEQMQPPIWGVARSFDFTRMFPNLDTVTVLSTGHFTDPDEFDAMIEQVNARLLATPSPDRVVNIKHLKLHHLFAGRRRSAFRILAQLFPNVEKLSIQEPQIAIADIRNLWADLKEVHFTLWSTAHILKNHDSVFCGIFPEEVALLREQDDDYLRRVNIVPIVPTIAYLKELTTFKVLYERRRDAYVGPIDDPTCLFSKVTPLIAFQRCPNLNVTLTAKDDERFAQALDHLRPYAPIVFEKLTT